MTGADEGEKIFCEINCFVQPEGGRRALTVLMSTGEEIKMQGKSKFETEQKVRASST